MPYSIGCKDVGVDCDYVAEGKTEKELFENVRDHARKAHGLMDIPTDVSRKMNRFLREDKAA